jgi:dTDP-4-amino-4,6-dideoxygalactose transaminase
VSRIYLSPPDVGDVERRLLLQAFDSNWIAPMGPNVDAFEREMADYLGVADAAALSSGTAALHLALIALGVGAGDEVLVPTLTFAATANAVVYVGARPVFIDSDRATWNIDPGLLEEDLEDRSRRGRLPAAVIAVDLYGRCADWDAILAACNRYDVPVVDDAAEAVGASYRGRRAGSFGVCGVLSFNGNKIMTTGGGGMLLSHQHDLIDRARQLAA